MNRKSALSRQYFGVMLTLSACLGVTGSLAQEPQQEQQPGNTDAWTSEFTYSDNWKIVSAPPPPGPYQTINVDPRVPGQEDNMPPPSEGSGRPADTAAQVMDRIEAAPPSAGVPAAPSGQMMDSFTAAPPSADVPAAQRMPFTPPAQQTPYGYGSAPGYSGYYRPHDYGQGRPAPMQTYPRVSGYPRPGYPGAGYGPSPRDAAPPAVAEEAIPPPPVYNRMEVPAGSYDYRSGRR